MNNKSSTKAYTKLQDRHDLAAAEIEKYKLLVDSIQDYAIFWMDQKGYIQTWNKGAERNKGYEPHEIIGKHFSIFYTQQDKDAKKPERELEIADRFGRAEDEDWRVRKDGTMFWASVVITTLRDPDGAIVGYAKVTRDLTERKRYEDELRRANEQLIRQRKDLERLNVSKDEFISLASHQLRTPATAVKQLLGMYVEGFDSNINEDALQVIKKAYDSNERQIATINSLLKVAQLDSGKVELKNEETDLIQLVQSVIDEAHESFKLRRQQLSIQYPDYSVIVPADSRYLRMAVENIVSNSSKYTHEHGAIQIKLTIEADHAILSIKDNGVGIPPHELPKLFDKFNRIPSELSDKVGGTGLGLYWSRKIIDLHGGSLDVDSQEGVGSNFKINLPLGARHA